MQLLIRSIEITGSFTMNSRRPTSVIITMNLRVSDICSVLKYVLVYLFLCMAVKEDILTLSQNVDWKMRPKNMISGPIYTYVKTDKQANIKWGVRHYIPRGPRTLMHVIRPSN